MLSCLIGICIGCIFAGMLGIAFDDIPSKSGLASMWLFIIGNLGLAITLAISLF